MTKTETQRIRQKLLMLEMLAKQLEAVKLIQVKYIPEKVRKEAIKKINQEILEVWRK